ncbi:copper chaperone PCu(A)C [Caviibacterium pharyngocola]|uniref:Molecular chaperone n=1 Tax=Caviibacterium pharyngocola TaxID=28159 RepID=A0A2M8RU84_9PAST|nr:copper chaperone PCu(A)C [Caviibacterium pharyngocola]PJG82450.1 molecular chaperone [Caviibacterium pharyngocola]
MRTLFKIGLICTALLPFYASAKITVEQAQIIATKNAGEPSAIFMQISNDAPQGVGLVIAESDVARLELHGMQQGKMHALQAIDIPPAGKTALKRGGLHIMAFDSKQAILAGSRFPLKLFFDNGEILSLDAVAIEP